MCRYCAPLIKAIDRYLTKADDDLADALADEGFVKGKKTAKAISELEEEIADALTDETDYILAEVDKSADLDTFAEDVWPKVKLNDGLRAKLAEIFKEDFAAFVPEYAGYYLAELDKGLKIINVSKRTTAWVESWSADLANIMQLNSHKEIETILTKGLKDGISISEFSRNIMDSGIRDEWYKARRTAVTEVLTAHRVAQQEAFLQDPAVEEKMWRHTGIYIHGPRQNHLDMDGQRVPKTEPYELVGADGVTYYPQVPGDSSLPPGERIECHCISQGIVNEDVLGLPLEERQRLQAEAIAELDDDWEKELEDRNKAMVGYTDDEE